MRNPTALADTAQHTLAALSGGAAAAGVMSQVDGWSLAAAFMGAVVFVLQSTELAVWKRLVFLPISVFIGYIAADEVMSHSGLGSRAVAAFVAAALTITVITRLMTVVKTYDFNLSAIFKRR